MVVASTQRNTYYWPCPRKFGCFSGKVSETVHLNSLDGHIAGDGHGWGKPLGEIIAFSDGDPEEIVSRHVENLARLMRICDKEDESHVWLSVSPWAILGNGAFDHVSDRLIRQ